MSENAEIDRFTTSEELRILRGVSKDGSSRALMVRDARKGALLTMRIDARNDGQPVRSNNCRISVVIRPCGDIISFMMVK